MNRRSFLRGVTASTLALSTRGVGADRLSAATPFSARFEDVAAHAGLTKPTIFGERTGWKYILETTGCGAAFFDYDNDGWQDIFLVNGQTLDATEASAPSNQLLHNNRDGTFTDITRNAGLVRSGWGQGVCIGDYDNDGFDDVFVTYWGHNILYHNNGDGTFTDVTKRAGLFADEVRWGTGCAFLDYDRDGWLDLFVANYLDFDLKTAPLPGDPGCIFRGLAVNCGPKGFPRGKCHLYHNNGDGSFTEVSERTGIAKAPLSYGLNVLVADFNNDSLPDIYMANDTDPSYLFWNKGDGTFVEGGLAAGVATSRDGRRQSGMGLAAGDYNCDGLLDIFKGNFSDDVPNLYRNAGDGFFEDVSMESGLGLHTLNVVWGCGFFDADNDGWLDLLYVNGHVYPEVERLKSELGFAEPILLYQNLKGEKFVEASHQAGAVFNEKLSGRGCAFGDYDNNGSIDVLINPINDVPRLLKCICGNGNNWIKLKLVGTKSNRSAIGARVRCLSGNHQQIDEVRSGGSHFSQGDLRIHFGLGDGARVDLLEISWPSGHLDRLKDVAVNRIITIREGYGAVPSGSH
jgi:hypothetical protein